MLKERYCLNFTTQDIFGSVTHYLFVFWGHKLGLWPPHRPCPSRLFKLSGCAMATLRLIYHWLFKCSPLGTGLLHGLKHPTEWGLQSSYLGVRLYLHPTLSIWCGCTRCSSGRVVLHSLFTQSSTPTFWWVAWCSPQMWHCTEVQRWNQSCTYL